MSQSYRLAASVRFEKFHDEFLAVEAKSGRTFHFSQDAAVWFERLAEPNHFKFDKSATSFLENLVSYEILEKIIAPNLETLQSISSPTPTLRSVENISYDALVLMPITTTSVT